VVVGLFWLLSGAACLYAARFGGQDGRRAAGVITVAVLLTFGAEMIDPTWQTINHAVMLVDGLVWVALMGFMLRSRRYFPIWMAAAQTNTLLSHGATMIAAVFDHHIYAGIATIWAIPCMFSMVLGIALDRTAGLKG
jgi:hypothetical protein